MRYYVRAKAPPLVKALILIGSVVLLVLVWTTSSTTTWAQAPRPTLTFTSTPTETPTPTPTSEVTLTPTPTPVGGVTPVPTAQPPTMVYSGPTLRGRVINVSTGQMEADVKVVFTTGGISVEVMSDENGEYAFDHLGTANGLLNVVPARGSGLRPVTVDLAVQSKEGVETIVNLGVTSNGVGAPPLIPIAHVSPRSVGAGDIMTVTVSVENTLPRAISGAIVTNWLPARLTPVGIHSSTGNPYFSDNLAIVELGRLDAGSAVVVEIAAQVSGGQTSASALRGRVSFFYREDAAAQALNGAGGVAPTVLPVTGMGLPLLGLALIVVVVIVGWMRRRVGRAPSAN